MVHMHTWLMHNFESVIHANSDVQSQRFEGTKLSPLHQLGLEPNHAVAILGFNSPEWVISSLGAMFAG